MIIKQRDNHDKFLQGEAVAACQIKGTYDVDGRGLSTSDLRAYDPSLKRADIKKEGGNTLAGIKTTMQDSISYFPKRYGIDFYHTYEQDFALLEELGLQAFRTSISWNRIFPKGDGKEPSEKELWFYDQLINEIIKDSMGPIITMSHYDFPVHLVTECGDFANRKVIDFFVNHVGVPLRRYEGKVKYWTVSNQVNLVPAIQLDFLSIYGNQSERMEELMYQAVHHQFVAGAGVIQLAREADPDARMETMVADDTFYPATCEPQNMILTTKKSRMQYYFTDVQLRDEYPGYALRYLKNNSIHLNIQEQDKKLLKTYTMGFLAVPCYYSKIVGSDKNTTKPFDGEQSPFLRPTPWEWRTDPLGPYNCLSQYWNRYEKPLMIAESGLGALDVVEEDEEVHDTYHIEYLRRHVMQVQECRKDGVDILAYLSWAPIGMVSSSSVEMSKRYGYIYVDLDDYGRESGKRLKKDSFCWYQHVIKTNDREL